MLGDTKQDVLCAKNAGVISVLVGWSMALPREKAVGGAETRLYSRKSGRSDRPAGVDKRKIEHCSDGSQTEAMLNIYRIYNKYII